MTKREIIKEFKEDRILSILLSILIFSFLSVESYYSRGGLYVGGEYLLLVLCLILSFRVPKKICDKKLEELSLFKNIENELNKDGIIGVLVEERREETFLYFKDNKGYIRRKKIKPSIDNLDLEAIKVLIPKH